MVVNYPPMGWNTWNTFGANINEELILQSVDAMLESGLSDAGYKYIVIDDMWALKERDKNGKMVPDPNKFPNGMKYIADYIHSKGLKFGMYSCAGHLTCAGYPGSYEYEWIDAATFAEWEIDFLKYDYCYHSFSESPDILYKRMSLALANCGRDILFSACTWGADNTRLWIKETGAQMWRSDGDICDSWASIKGIAQRQMHYFEYNGRGCFNDMDMLVVGMHGKGNVGMTGCTFDEYKTHFTLWALLNSPLMLGCDIRNMDDETKQLLTNREVIAINQDPAGMQPFFANQRISLDNCDSNQKSLPINMPIIAKLLDNGDIAIGVFNLMDVEKWDGNFTVLPDRLGLPLSTGKTLRLTELWTGETVNSKNGVVPTGKIAPHSCVLFRCKIIDCV